MKRQLKPIVVLVMVMMLLCALTLGGCSNKDVWKSTDGRATLTIDNDAGSVTIAMDDGTVYKSDIYFGSELEIHNDGNVGFYSIYQNGKKSLKLSGSGHDIPHDYEK